jgi:hypothetical protein
MSMNKPTFDPASRSSRKPNQVITDTFRDIGIHFESAGNRAVFSTKINHVSNKATSC